MFLGGCMAYCSARATRRARSFVLLNIGEPPTSVTVDVPVYTATLQRGTAEGGGGGGGHILRFSVEVSSAQAWQRKKSNWVLGWIQIQAGDVKLRR